MKKIRLKIVIRGVVQGVGFRPFVFNLAKDYENLIVTRTFSKFYGQPGMRVGYASGCKYLITKLEEDAPVFPVSTPSIILAMKILENHDFFNVIKERIDRNRKKLIKLVQNNLTFFMGESLTQTVVFGCRNKEINLWELLQEENILCVSLEEEGKAALPNCVRLTVHSNEESFLCLYKAIQRIIQKSVLD